MKKLRAILLATTLSLLCSSTLHAAEGSQPYGDESPLLNWYFASAFGSGFYKVGDTKVLSLRLPFSLGEAATERDSLSLRVIAPVTIGFASRSGDISQEAPDNLGSLSGSLGLELDWLPTRSTNWHVRPFFTVGSAREFSQDLNATLYTGGVRTRYEIASGRSNFGIGGSIVAANINTRDRQEKLGELSIGLDWQTDSWSDAREPMRLGFQLVQYWYFNKLNFLSANSNDYEVDRVTEVGVYTMPRKPWRVFGFDMDRAGVAYRHGANLRGVVLVTSFPF